MKKAVEAPKGFHWMKNASGKGFKLMKGEYKTHPGAVKKASFEVQKAHRQSPPAMATYTQKLSANARS